LSKLIETQAEFQRLADERIDEARALLAVGKWGGAYYLAGYGVELALKSCIIKRLMATDAFPKKDFSKDCYTHALGRLVELAGLETAFDAAKGADATLKNNWLLVKDWSEEKRYHLITEAEARDLFSAVADTAHGVQTWVKTHW
jgi:hypothetical protein